MQTVMAGVVHWTRARPLACQGCRGRRILTIGVEKDNAPANPFPVLLAIYAEPQGAIKALAAIRKQRVLWLPNLCKRLNEPFDRPEPLVEFRFVNVAAQIGGEDIGKEVAICAVHRHRLLSAFVPGALASRLE